MEMLVELCCSVDDFWKNFSKQWEQHLINHNKSPRGPKAEMSIPELTTISILFHQSGHRTFKNFYCNMEEQLLELVSLIQPSCKFATTKELEETKFLQDLQKWGKQDQVGFLDLSFI